MPLNNRNPKFNLIFVDGKVVGASPTFSAVLDSANEGLRRRREQHQEQVDNHSSQPSNLTLAIKNRALVDWEALEGVKVSCVHPDIGTLQGVLKRASVDGDLGTDNAWTIENSDVVWEHAFHQAWHGVGGWELRTEGPYPVKICVASQLRPGSVFQGVLSGGRQECYVVVFSPSGGKQLMGLAGLIPLEKVGLEDVRVVAVFSGGVEE